MRCSFTCKGHSNIRATHPTTIEFTKDSELTPKGDCILGVSADFDYKALKEMLTQKKAIVDLQIGKEKDSLICVPNKAFASTSEVVLRKSSFMSERTFATHASKGSQDINRKLIKLLKSKEAVLHVTIHD